MQLSRRSVNVFVFGDLVLDHVIYLQKKKQPYQPIGEGKVYSVGYRTSTAGGAANCARILATLGAGRVSLWGLIGHSRWGTFTEIIEICHTIDCSDSRIIFHGAHEEALQMNTITRMIIRDELGRHHHGDRFDDITYINATFSQVAAALNRLESEYKNYGLKAIILNDLDMNALTPPLVTRIARFAKKKRIPLFIDPKRHFEKYSAIHATCVLPNLNEWCHIVKQIDNEDLWRHGLDDPGILERMVTLSLRYMPKITYHIIKCDKDGALIIAPDNPEAPSKYVVYHVLPHSTNNKEDVPHQIGTGDVMTAMLAAQYASSKDKEDHKRLLDAFRTANRVVAAYRQMDWHRMPNRKQIESLRTESPGIVRRTTIPAGVLYLPPPDSPFVRMRDVSTRVEGLVSVDETYKGTIVALMDFLLQNWGGENPRSAILTGRGGTGKTQIIDALKREMDERIVMDDRFAKQAKLCKNLRQVQESIERKWKALPDQTTGLLLVLDEAFSVAGRLLFGDRGKLLLDMDGRANSCTRFLFIDADYERYRQKLSGSQFLSRCEVFTLPPIGHRLRDVPYIFASRCLSQARKRKYSGVSISEAVLLATINWILTTPDKDQSPRNIIKEADRMVSAQASVNGRGRILTLTRSHLATTPLKGHAGPTESQRKLFEFMD